MGKIHFSTVVLFLLAVVLLCLGIYWQRLAVYRRLNRWANRLWWLAWIGFVAWVVSLGLFFVALQQRMTSDVVQSHTPLSAIIILGSGMTEGKPTPTLANRLDTAVHVYHTHPKAVLVVSGGVARGKNQSEAEIMATYLTRIHGVPVAAIHQERCSTSTEENLKFSQAILHQQGIGLHDHIAIVTSDFHTIRASAIAHHQGYEQVSMVASATPSSIRYNAWFREYFACISGWLLGEY